MIDKDTIKLISNLDVVSLLKEDIDIGARACGIYPVVTFLEYLTGFT